MSPRVAVAILDYDMQPISFSMTPDFVREVAARLAFEKEKAMPAPRTARYSVERERLQVLRQLGGLDPAADLPPDEMAAWKHLEDTHEYLLPKEEDQSGTS
ncbi:MAG: hypothetical protein ACHQ0J_05055 [Candidatus Dormibacterales bacterium]